MKKMLILLAIVSLILGTGCTRNSEKNDLYSDWDNNAGWSVRTEDEEVEEEEPEEEEDDFFKIMERIASEGDAIDQYNAGEYFYEMGDLDKARKWYEIAAKNGDEEAAYRIKQMDEGTLKPFKNLNQIRFEGWTDEDYVVNDYIREVRKYIDEYNEGKIIGDEILDNYKDLVSKSKFMIYTCEESLMGGLIIYLNFVDNPSLLFSCWVYSYVDIDLEKVTAYEFRGWWSEGPSECSVTAEDINEAKKAYPDVMLEW